jgi:hypothetical protein
MDQSQADELRVMHEADQQIQSVRNEKAAVITPLQGTNKAGTPVSTFEDQDAASAPFDQKAADIRNQARERMKQIQRQAQQDARRAAQ